MVKQIGGHILWKLVFVFFQNLTICNKCVMSDQGQQTHSGNRLEIFFFQFGPPFPLDDTGAPNNDTFAAVCLLYCNHDNTHCKRNTWGR